MWLLSPIIESCSIKLDVFNILWLPILQFALIVTLCITIFPTPIWDLFDTYAKSETIDGILAFKEINLLKNDNKNDKNNPLQSTSLSNPNLNLTRKTSSHSTYNTNSTLNDSPLTIKRAKKSDTTTISKNSQSIGKMSQVSRSESNIVDNDMVAIQQHQRSLSRISSGLEFL